MSKAKKFWEDHKKEIIGATVVVAGGIVCYALCRNYKEIKYYRKIFKNLNEFDNDFLDTINKMQKGCDCACSMIAPPDTTVEGLPDGVKTAMDIYMSMDQLITPDTAVGGVLVFLK